LSAITVKEGDKVEVAAVATDPDGDDVTITYSQPLGEDGVWATEVGDAGTYLVTVTASDGVAEDKQTITIVVEGVNSPPVIELDNLEETLQAGETKVIELSPVVTDADGDDITVTYGGWMTSASKEITEDDEGDHEVTVTATDGVAETSVTITVTVELNTPPDFII